MIFPTESIIQFFTHRHISPGSVEKTKPLHSITHVYSDAFECIAALICADTVDKIRI